MLLLEFPSIGLIALNNFLKIKLMWRWEQMILYSYIEASFKLVVRQNSALVMFFIQSFRFQQNTSHKCLDVKMTISTWSFNILLIFIVISELKMTILYIPFNSNVHFPTEICTWQFFVICEKKSNRCRQWS